RLSVIAVTDGQEPLGSHSFEEATPFESSKYSAQPPEPPRESESTRLRQPHFRSRHQIPGSA
ncbi:MAG: hypothetical protein ABSD20_14100, partial [Terriglobales bacterium]